VNLHDEPILGQHDLSTIFISGADLGHKDDVAHVVGIRNTWPWMVRKTPVELGDFIRHNGNGRIRVAVCSPSGCCRDVVLKDDTLPRRTRLKFFWEEGWSSHIRPKVLVKDIGQFHVEERVTHESLAASKPSRRLRHHRAPSIAYLNFTLTPESSTAAARNRTIA
jgi:hypothetical protein